MTGAVCHRRIGHVAFAWAFALSVASCGDDDGMSMTTDGGATDARGAGRDGALDPDGSTRPDGGPCARDVVPPVLACPAATTVALAAPAPALPPTLSAADACDGIVPAVAEPRELMRGATDVAYVASDLAGNATTCTTNVRVLEAFAPEGLRVLHAELDGADRTSVMLGWEPSTGADATAYRIERGPTEDGPWETLGVLPLTTTSHVEATLPSGAWRYRVVTLAGDVDGGASASVAVHSMAAAEYNLRDRPVATVPFPTSLYALVRHPADLTRGPYPLVLLLHGNHGNCRSPDPDEDDACVESTTHECPEAGFTTAPNALGLLYLAETLAAQGFVAATVSANALNCRDDFIFERAELLLAHLGQWQAWAEHGGEPFGSRFAGIVDLTRVGLVGHSRGGEAVAHVPALLASRTPDMRIASVFAIAPTDYHDPIVRSVPYAVLLPGCDGDVSDLSGMHVYDRSEDPADPVARAQVLFPRTNHNFFSREWRFDDNFRGLYCDRRLELGAQVQQRTLETILGSWMLHTSSGRPIEPFMRADADTPSAITTWIGLAPDLRWSYAAPDRVVVSDFEEPGAPERNRLSSSTFVDFGTAILCARAECGTVFAHQKNGVLLGWDMPMPLASFGLGTVDASSYSALSFRIVSRYSRRNTELTEQDFVVRLRDADGTAVELPLSAVRRVLHLYPTNNLFEVLQTIRVPLAELAAASPELDLRSLAALEMSMGGIEGHESGSIVVTDLELAR